MVQTPQAPINYFSFEDYYAYDDGTGNRYELVDGELVLMPPESIFNSDISMRLLLELAKIVPLHLLKYKEI
ncbi:MAG: Uma2 family endonuclease, partial [Sphaerospermopsis kisseleviana]